MSIAVLLDEPNVPARGSVEIDIKRRFKINVTAEEARRAVQNWLLNEVSTNIGAEMPTLVLTEAPVWRVPAWLGFPRYGRVGTVGTVDVDVETGVLQNLEQSKSCIENCAEELVKRLPTFPTYPPSHIIPLPHIQAKIPPAPILTLDEEDFEPTEPWSEEEMLQRVLRS